MTEILKSEIFFFISSVIAVFIFLLLAIILMYIISILRDVKKVSKAAREGVDTIAADVKEFHGGLKGFIQFVSVFLSSLIGKNKKKNHGKKEKK